jgi:3-oxocholest-4-en-26-oyl-CoA dehydrogenase alpha subunit
VNFEEPAELTTLRAEVREFLAEYITDEVHERTLATGTMHDWPFYRALGARGWIGINWPLGALGAGRPARHPLAAAILFEEANRAWAPLYGMNTTAITANAILRCGSEGLRAAIIPTMLEGEIIVALGFSEAESGTDVAASKTTATRAHGGWLINGQKVFTSLAEEAEYIFLVARSSRELAPKQGGLSTFLVPRQSEGLEIQPLITVAERTNITFYHDVFVPDALCIGAPGEGWDVLRVALTFERGGKGFHGHLVRLVEDVVAALSDDGVLRNAGSPSDAFLADLGRAAVETEVARLLDQRTAWIGATGGMPTVEGSMAKLYSTESLTNLVNTFMDHLGPKTLLPPGEPGALAHGWIEYAQRFAIPTTVYAGVSEVQRSLIAERRFGFPRSR